MKTELTVPKITAESEGSAVLDSSHDDEKRKQNKKKKQCLY